MEGTHRTFFGLMIKHQRVQMAPVAVKAAFWVRERVSAGRQKSETPARTSAHCYVIVSYIFEVRLNNEARRVGPRVLGVLCTFMTGALSQILASI